MMEIIERRTKCNVHPTYIQYWSMTFDNTNIILSIGWQKYIQ